MKRKAILISIICTFIGGGVISEVIPAEKKADPIEDMGYDSGSLNDFRFTIRNVSFNARYKSNGTGKVLDVIFDIENETEEEIPLSYAVFAFYEKNLVDRKYRLAVEYPKWRDRDFEAEAWKIHYGVVSPKDITKEDRIKIWDEIVKEDYDLCINKKNKKENCDFTKFRTEKVIKKRGLYPPMWRTVDFIQKNYKKFGQDFTLAGRQASKVPAIQLDTKEKELGKIFHGRNQTTIISSHESIFRPNQYFFNKIVVLIFDPNDDGRVLFRRFYKFTRTTKIR